MATPENRITMWGHTSRRLWEAEMGVPVLSSCAVTDTSVIVGGRDRRLFHFSCLHLVFGFGPRRLGFDPRVVRLIVVEIRGGERLMILLRIFLLVFQRKMRPRVKVVGRASEFVTAGLGAGLRATTGCTISSGP